jgi:hypothetical protein
MTTSRFNLWPWMPLFVIGAAAIANGVLYFVAAHVRPEKVEAQPFVASSRIDGEKLAAERFIALGFNFQIKATDAKNITLSIIGNSTVSNSATVHFYRPDNPAGDFTVPWPDPTKPVAVTLARPGMWRLLVTFPDANGAELRCESAIDTIAVTQP